MLDTLSDLRHDIPRWTAPGGAALARRELPIYLAYAWQGAVAAIDTGVREATDRYDRLPRRYLNSAGGHAIGQVLRTSSARWYMRYRDAHHQWRHLVERNRAAA